MKRRKNSLVSPSLIEQLWREVPRIDLMIPCHEMTKSSREMNYIIWYLAAPWPKIYLFLFRKKKKLVERYKLYSCCNLCRLSYNRIFFKQKSWIVLVNILVCLLRKLFWYDSFGLGQFYNFCILNIINVTWRDFLERFDL